MLVQTPSPTDADQPIGELLSNFYQENNLPADGGENDRWFYLKFGPVYVPIPNTKGRRAIVYLHDIHHMINDYSTSWEGEAAVSAWEVATGLGKHWTGWALSLSVFVVGVWLFPRSTYAAFVRGRRTKGVIALNESKEALLAKSIPEMQALTGVHPQTTYTEEKGDRLAYAFWAALATLLYGGLWIGGLLLLWWFLF